MIRLLDFQYSGSLVAKPRMTRSDRWKKRPAVQRWFAYKDALLAQAQSASYHPEAEQIIGLHVIFYLAMPKSWSKKKKREHRDRRHEQRPDLSNLLKGVEDALTANDQTITDLSGTKWWSDTESYMLVRMELRNANRTPVAADRSD